MLIRRGAMGTTPDLWSVSGRPRGQCGQACLRTRAFPSSASSTAPTLLLGGSEEALALLLSCGMRGKETENHAGHLSKRGLSIGT